MLAWLMNMGFAAGDGGTPPVTTQAPEHMMRNFRDVTYQRSPFNYIWRLRWTSSLIPFW